MSNERLTDEELARLIENGASPIQLGEFEALIDSLACELLSARQRIYDALSMTRREDGTEYEHDHGIGSGHDQCPACWAEDIQDALKENGK